MAAVASDEDKQEFIFQGAGEEAMTLDANTEISGLRQHVSGRLRRSLMVLWCAVGLILLIACVNLSNLLLARLAGRSKEFAMRTALAAGLGRLIRQLLTMPENRGKSDADRNS
jgi:hypothetical protein